MVKQVLETPEVGEYLASRNLEAAYKKAKNYILKGLSSTVRLSKRKPISAGIWYFRITKKYRAFAKLDDKTLVVFAIDDHQ